MSSQRKSRSQGRGTPEGGAEKSEGVSPVSRSNVPGRRVGRGFDAKDVLLGRLDDATVAHVAEVDHE